MKLWEMIQTGKVGDRFRCVSDESSWNGIVFELSPTSHGYCIKNINKEVGSLGYLLEMCGTAIIADWVKVPKPVVYVGFWEAYKAFMNGSRIQSVESERIYKNESYAIAFSTEVINGKWIILED